MADLSIHFAGIVAPNPFWLASGPPTNTARQAHRAFEAGWGGIVWKTIGEPIVNVSSRYSALSIGGVRMAGFNNIELISDRSIATNFREIAEIKKTWPDRALIASLMTDTRANWHDLIKRGEDAGVDGFELNFGCPHGMCERGMGSAVGQNPDVTEEITSWVMAAASRPVLVKLTPNITNIVHAARAARRGGANAISLINTVSSIIRVDLDSFVAEPALDGASTHGGYCGPAVKPIALNMLQSCAQDSEVGLPLSGIGGIATWRDAAEFLALGATSVQVCTAVMHHGFRIVEDMIDGLNFYLDSKGMKSVSELTGRALPSIRRWENLNLNYQRVARIDYDRCIRCNLCHIACEDGAHQCIDLVDAPSDCVGSKIPKIREEDCVGCNLCQIVCPVDGCISMVDLPADREPMSWNQYQSLLADGAIAPIPPHP
jgi:dihydropyrimidine dehydrogenase (NAD+) subunit PreA